MERFAREHEIRVGARGKLDRPGQARRQPEAAPVQEAPEPPDPDAERHARRRGVADPPYREPRPPDVRDAPGDREDVAAVQHEPTFPDTEHAGEIPRPPRIASTSRRSDSVLSLSSGSPRRAPRRRKSWIPTRNATARRRP